MDVVDFLLAYKAEHPQFTDILVATRLGYEGNSPVSMVLRRERNISEDMIKKWADAYELAGKEREEFIELANVKLSSDWLRRQYFSLKDRIEALEKDKRGLIEEIQEVKLLLADMRRAKDKP